MISMQPFRINHYYDNDPKVPSIIILRHNKSADICAAFKCDLSLWGEKEPEYLKK